MQGVYIVLYLSVGRNNNLIMMEIIIYNIFWHSIKQCNSLRIAWTSFIKSINVPPSPYPPNAPFHLPVFKENETEKTKANSAVFFNTHKGSEYEHSTATWRILVQKVTKMSQRNYWNFTVRCISLQAHALQSLNETKKESVSRKRQYFKHKQMEKRRWRQIHLPGYIYNKNKTKNKYLKVKERGTIHQVRRLCKQQ